MNIENPSANESIESPIDFLDENLEVEFAVDPEAAKHFPKITQEDFKSRKEKFRILLGDFDITEGGVSVNIRGVMEADDVEGYYQEGEDEVVGINIPRYREDANSLRREYPEYRNFGLVGDLHTHPVHPNEVDHAPWEISLGDRAEMIRAYKDGSISSEQPHVFVVVGVDEKGKNKYSFNRLIRKGKDFAVETSILELDE
ncbi:MAG: hypothetical protein Q8Q32_02405 [bacterium]|nr:hypothetical protein [bacterium]